MVQLQQVHGNVSLTASVESAATSLTSVATQSNMQPVVSLKRLNLANIYFQRVSHDTINSENVVFEIIHKSQGHCESSFITEKTGDVSHQKKMETKVQEKKGKCTKGSQKGSKKCVKIHKVSKDTGKEDVSLTQDGDQSDQCSTITNGGESRALSVCKQVVVQRNGNSVVRICGNNSQKRGMKVARKMPDDIERCDSESVLIRDFCEKDGADTENKCHGYEERLSMGEDTQPASTITMAVIQGESSSIHSTQSASNANATYQEAGNHQSITSAGITFDNSGQTETAKLDGNMNITQEVECVQVESARFAGSKNITQVNSGNVVCTKPKHDSMRIMSARQIGMKVGQEISEEVSKNKAADKMPATQIDCAKTLNIKLACSLNVFPGYTSKADQVDRSCVKIDGASAADQHSNVSLELSTGVLETTPTSEVLTDASVKTTKDSAEQTVDHQIMAEKVTCKSGKVVPGMKTAEKCTTEKRSMTNKVTQKMEGDAGEFCVDNPGSNVKHQLAVIENKCSNEKDAMKKCGLEMSSHKDTHMGNAQKQVVKKSEHLSKEAQMGNTEEWTVDKSDHGISLVGLIGIPISTIQNVILMLDGPVVSLKAVEQKLNVEENVVKDAAQKLSDGSVGRLIILTGKKQVFFKALPQFVEEARLKSLSITNMDYKESFYKVPAISRLTLLPWYQYVVDMIVKCPYPREQFPITSMGLMKSELYRLTTLQKKQDQMDRLRYDQKKNSPAKVQQEHTDNIDESFQSCASMSSDVFTTP